VRNALKARRENIMTELEKTTEVKKHIAPGYKYISELGSGNMGEVFLCERDGNKFAIKKFRKFERTSDRESVASKFLKVTNKAALIIHPNVVKIIEYGFPISTETPYIVMEYVEGHPLSHYIGSNELSLQKKIDLIKQTTDALDCIHDCGILHRDMKPANILVENKTGEAKITDFGISSLLEQNYTTTDNLRGSPAYMAPECFESVDKICRASDIFSLGVLSYELLTGIRPFYGETLAEIMNSIKNDIPVAPRKIISDIPENVQKAIEGMLRKKPEERLTPQQILSELKCVAK